MDCSILKLAVVFGVLSFTLAELDDKRQIAASSAHSPKKDKQLPRPYDGYKDSRKYFQYYPVYYGPILMKKDGDIFVATPYDKGEEGFYPKEIKWGNKDGGYGEYYFDFNHDKDDVDDDSVEDDDSHMKDDEEHGDDFDHKDKKKHPDVGFAKGRHLADVVEILPGYKLDQKKPYHGGNYRKL